MVNRILRRRRHSERAVENFREICGAFASIVNRIVGATRTAVSAARARARRHGTCVGQTGIEGTSAETTIQGTIMRFLLRMTFWLGVILVLLPSFASGNKSDAPATPGGAQLSAAEAVSAASSTVGDLSRFCTRQPEACAIGAEAAAVLSEKAQAGAKILYRFLNDRRAAQNTGSVGQASPQSKASQNTLTPTDVSPSWRGPQPVKEAPAKPPA